VDLGRGEPAFGADEGQDGSGGRMGAGRSRKLALARGFFVEDDPGAKLGGHLDHGVEFDGRVDLGEIVAAALLEGFSGDFVPARQAVLDAGRGGPGYLAFGEEGNPPADAEFGHGADQIIHLPFL